MTARRQNALTFFDIIKEDEKRFLIRKYHNILFSANRQPSSLTGSEIEKIYAPEIKGSIETLSKEKIQETNKRFLHLLGCGISSENNYFLATGLDDSSGRIRFSKRILRSRDEAIKHFDNVLVFQAKFHKSYDWMTLVLDFIESFGYSIVIEKKTGEDYVTTISDDKGYIQSTPGKTRLSSMYLAALLFINLQKEESKT